MVASLVMIQEFYCTNTPEYINIPSCSEKLVCDSSLLQEGIFVYKLVKLYNKLTYNHAFTILFQVYLKHRAMPRVRAILLNVVPVGKPDIKWCFRVYGRSRLILKGFQLEEVR